jgi:hypothetical protein
VPINAAISNPSFELWLLLHYKKVEELDLSLIKQNPWEGLGKKRKRYIKKLLRTVVGRSRKRGNYKEYDFDLIRNAIDNAESALLCSKKDELFEKAGTTVNDLIKIIFGI